LDTVKIFFERPKPFELPHIKTLMGVVGLYFIFLNEMKIQYPFKQSRLIYIGMSEKKTNSIGRRLQGHFDGSSGNEGLVNYRKVEPVFFTHINFDMVRSIWPLRIEDLESFFILDFLRLYGVYPICNNKTGFEILKSELKIDLKIEWSFFQ
jgi:hypothetical protein